MKQYHWLTAALLLASPALWALRPGDEAMELKMKWVQGLGRPLLPQKDDDQKSPELKAVVFLLTRAANREETVRLLSELQRSYANEVALMAATPDGMRDAELFLKAFPEFKVPFAVDEKRSITANYMNGSLLYPMAFLVDGDGVIVWNGEAVDLGEAISRYRAGTLDLKTQKKIAPMIDELQTLLRDVNDRRTGQVVDAILRADPGNPTTLRLRLFLLERSERAAEGWELISTEIKKSPKLARLYFMALDLAMRNPVLADKIGEIAQNYLNSVPANADSDNLMAWTLLNRAPESAAALIAARQLVDRMKPIDAPPDALQAAQLTTRAMLAYRLGKIAEALELQKQALTCWKKAEMEPAAADAERRLQYYETVQKLR